MKKITLAILLTLILSIFFTAYQNVSEVESVTEKFIRIHVIANSDSDKDQSLKLRVRDAVIAASRDFLLPCATKSEAMDAISHNMSTISKAAQSAAGECKAVCTLKKEYFGARTYDGFTLPAGEYDSLCIRLGKAEGKNWWCICYPQLCIGAAIKIEDENILTEGELKIVKEPQKVKYKLYCYELFLKIKSLFKKIG